MEIRRKHSDIATKFMCINSISMIRPGKCANDSKLHERASLCDRLSCKVYRFFDVVLPTSSVVSATARQVTAMSRESSSFMGWMAVHAVVSLDADPDHS